MGKIFALRVKERPTIEDIDITFKTRQEFVGGYPDCLKFPHNIVLWLNDEAKMRELKLNIVLLYRGILYDSIYGDVFFCSHDEKGNSIGLTDEQIDYLYSNIKVLCDDEGEAVFAWEMN